MIKSILYKLFCEGTSGFQAGRCGCRTSVHIHILSTHREQVEQVCVGVDVRWCGLDQRQLLKDGVQLLGLRQVDPRFLFVCPVWQRHVHGYQVFQVHAEYGEAEARALGEALSVLTVVPTRRHQFNEVVENLHVE